MKTSSSDPDHDGPTPDSFLVELKAEVATLKAILMNRNEDRAVIALGIDAVRDTCDQLTQRVIAIEESLDSLLRKVEGQFEHRAFFGFARKRFPPKSE